MRYYITIVLLFFIGFSRILSQEVVLDFECKQKSNKIKKQIFSISNKFNHHLAYFVKERDREQAILFDESFQPISQFDFESVKKDKYQIQIGTKVVDKDYSLFYSNINHSKFCVVTANFITKNVRLKKIDFDMGKEKYLKTVSHKNNVYILTSTPDNKIVIRELDDEYDLKILKTYNLDLNKKRRLYKKPAFQLKIYNSNKKANIYEIVNTIPNTIELASQSNKVYQQDDTLYLTFDSDKMESTVMIIISLVDFTFESKEFFYPLGKMDDYKSKNSFLTGKYLWQVAGSKEEMELVVKTMHDSVLKSHYLNKDNPIYFKNSAIIKETSTGKGHVVRDKQHDKVESFLRALSVGRIGVSAYQVDEFFNLSVGSAIEVRGGGMSMGAGGSPSYSGNGNMTATTSYSGPTNIAYGSNGGTSSNYFNTTLDLDFNYLKRKGEGNIFRKIKNYKKELKYCFNENVFFHNRDLYFSYFNMKSGRLKLVRF